MINLSLLILAQSNICWERKPNVRVLMRMPSIAIVLKKTMTSALEGLNGV